MITKTHTLDFIVDGAGLVRHGVDMMVEGAGDNYPKFDRFVHDWREWTVDSSETWEALWSGGRRLFNNMGGLRYAAKAANRLAIKNWDMKPDFSLSQDYEVWHLYGYDLPEGDESNSNNDGMTGTDATWFGDTVGRQVSSTPTEYFIVDGDDDVWQVRPVNNKTYVVSKLDQTTKCFQKVATRTVQSFEVKPDRTGSAVEMPMHNRRVDHAFYQVDDKIHMAWSDQAGTHFYQDKQVRFYYSCFDMSTETWDVENELVDTREVWCQATEQRAGVDLVVRSTDEVVMFICGEETTHGSDTTNYSSYVRRTGVDTWSAPVDWTESDTNSRVTDSAASKHCFLGKDDRVHFIYEVYTGSYKTYHRSLSDINVLDTVLLLSGYQIGRDGTSGKNGMRFVDGSDDVWLYYVFRGVNSEQPIEYWKWKSEANPTVSKLFMDTTNGVSHNVVKDITNGSQGQASAFVSSDGYLNFMVAESDTASSNPGDRSHEVSDGVGVLIYTAKSLDADFVFRHGVGYYQIPRGEITTGVNWTNPVSAWEWPYSAATMHDRGDHWETGIRGESSPETVGQEYSQLMNHGLVTIGGTDFIYTSTTRNAGNHVWECTVWPLIDVPVNKVVHTIDMIAKATETPEHTTDMRVVAEAGQQTIDHTVDMLLVERFTKTHAIDMVAVDIRTIDHTVDMFLTKTEIISVTITIDDLSVSATTVLAEVAGIQGKGQLSRKRYSTGRGIVRKDV